MVVTDKSGQAPGRLELVREFLNTRDIEAGTDELGSPDALAGWLAAHGLGGQRIAGPSEGEWRTAIALRESLREVLLAHAGGAAHDGPAGTELGSIAGALPVRLEVDAEGAICPVPAGAGVSAGLAGLLLIAAQARAEGTWTRLKVCGADDCRWAFYDRSHARRGAWCDMATCGNMIKNRNLRARQRT